MATTTIRSHPFAPAVIRLPHCGSLRADRCAVAPSSASTRARRCRRRVDARGHGRDRRVSNPYWFYPRVLVQRQTCRHAQPSPTQPASSPAPTRYVYFASFSRDQKPWRSLVEWMDTVGVPTDACDDDYDDLAHRQANFAHLQDLVECFFLMKRPTTRTTKVRRAGLPIGILTRPRIFSTTSTCCSAVLRRGRQRRPWVGALSRRALPILGVRPGRSARRAKARRAALSNSSRRRAWVVGAMTVVPNHSRPVADDLFTWPSDEPQLIASKCRACATVTFPAKPRARMRASRRRGAFVVSPRHLVDVHGAELRPKAPFISVRRGVRALRSRLCRSRG